MGGCFVFFVANVLCEDVFGIFDYFFFVSLRLFEYVLAVLSGFGFEDPGNCFGVKERQSEAKWLLLMFLLTKQYF